MDSWDTANLVLGCFCIVLSFLPTGYLISNNRYKRKLYLYSLLICVANIGMALGGLPEYLMDAVVEAGERRVLLLGGTLYYGAFTCLLFFFLQYFFEYLQLSGRERQLCSVGAFFMTGLLLLLTLASPWTGAAFTVDEDGLQMGPWFPLLQSVVLLCYLFVTIVILRHRSVLRRREFVFLLLYILIPLAGGLSRIVLPNIVLVNAGFTVATLLILMNVQFEHEVMLKEQEKQLAEGRIDIMLSQIQPHFLYNSLGVIYSLCATDPEAARKAIKRFSDFLRGNMDSLKNREPIPFEAELNHEYIRQSKQRRRWHGLTAVLATAAAVLTLCVMVLPAVTLENTPQALTCQLDDLHTHTDSCYDEEGELLCGYAGFVAHTHDSSCYGEDGTLICPLEERKPHTHTESCYQETEALVCGREETQGHTHTEACYETQLVCSQEESQGHTHTGHVHTDACYTVTQTRICESTEPDHVHTEECYETQRELTCTQDTGCYDANGNLVCGLEETQGHTHTLACYETQLVCGQEETEPHTHTDNCYQVQRELVCGQEEVILHTHTEECRDEEGNLTCGMVEIKEHVHDETCLPEEEVAPHTLAAQNEAVGTDFGPYITSTQVQVKSGDQWVDIVDGTVTDGSSIQVTIYYSITDSDIVTAENNIIYYQLPNGIRLTKEENGPVEVGDKFAGTYTITTDGRITITFNEGFADGHPFAGNISFHGEVSLADIEEGDDIVFGGAGGTITIVPDAGDTSLHIEKTGEYNQAEGKMYYTVTVSSEDGSDGPIHYTDKFLNPTGGIAYEEDSIQVLDSVGQEVEVEIDFKTGSTWFEIPNLPQLGPGEFYTITYTATVDPDDTTTEDGSLEARNQASAADESNQVSTIHEMEISGPRIEKIGVYNPSTREVVWTVYLYNPREYDLAGKTLRDTMTWTYGGKTLTQNIESATLTPYTGETPGESETIKLPYTFPEISTKSYILTYTTSLPEDAAVGANLSVTNTAWLDNWKAEYNIDGTVPGKTGLVKTFTGQGDGDAVESDLNWSSVITFPQGTLEAATLGSVRYVDIIQDAVNEGWQLQDGTHYTTPELLEQLVAAPVEGYTQLEALEYGTDYTIQVVTAADFQTTLGKTYYNATGVGYVFKTVAFDQLFNGFTFNGKTYKFIWQDLQEVADGTPIAMFAIEFTEAAVTKVNNAGQISISYSTHYDLSKVTGNGTYTLVNGGRTPSDSAAANTETALLAQLNKQVSTIGGHDYALESGAYTDENVAIDVGDTDGNIYYRILLYNFGDEISLQDTMWATQYGWSVGFDSIKVYDAATGDVLETLTIWGENGHLGSNPYWGTYTLKNLAAYRGCIIGLYYHVDVSAQVAEGETQTITNTVKWTDVAEDSVGTTVTNSKPTLEKESALADGENNLVYYYVTINPGAKDLHPESDRLQLEDTLTLPNGVSATLRPETIKLYTYNAENADGHYLGEDISDNPVFRVDQTEGEENSYIFTVPDQTACVVVYAYEIDRGTYAGDNIEVSNAAMLMGSAVISAGDEIQLDNQGSSSQANKATLTIYKIGGNDVSNLLQGVLFDLFRYEEQEGGGYEWVRTDVTAAGPPAGDGGNHFITGGDNVEGAIILNFLDEGGGNGNGSHYNTLYRLTEFETLPGYKLDTTPRYYVWGRNGATEESTQAAMADVLEKAGVTWGEVTFIPYGGSMTDTISNEPTTTEITVTKTWQGAEGTPLEEGLPDSVEVTLYQQTDGGEPVQYGESVTLTGEANWTYTWEQLPKEVDGQAVTYTVEETPITGWEASYDYGEGATGITEGTIQIINTKQSTFTLPETGGVGPTLVAIAGVPLVGAASVVYWNLRRKRRRGGKAP